MSEDEPPRSSAHETLHVRINEPALRKLEEDGEIWAPMMNGDDRLIYIQVSELGAADEQPGDRPGLQ